MNTLTILTEHGCVYLQGILLLFDFMGICEETIEGVGAIDSIMMEDYLSLTNFLYLLKITIKIKQEEIHYAIFIM